MSNNRYFLISLSTARPSISFLNYLTSIALVRVADNTVGFVRLSHTNISIEYLPAVDGSHDCVTVEEPVGVNSEDNHDRDTVVPSVSFI